jgi:maltooligosyltrehalose synthase
VVRCALALRRHAVDVFRGAYVPLERGALTIVPRLVLSLCRGRADAPIGPVVWGDATLRIPRALGQRLTNVLTGERLALTGGELRVADALATFPVALCWSDG